MFDLLKRIALRSEIPCRADFGPFYAPVQRAGMMDEQPSHHLPSQSKEGRALLVAVVTRLQAFRLNQFEIQLMHQRCGLPRMRGALVFHLCRCELAKFRVEQLNQLAPGAMIAMTQA